MANPRKPTALKVLAGNPGKRALPADEPTYAATGLEPPEWLSPEAAERWHPLAAALDANGMLTEPNREVLAGYVSMMTAFVEKLKATGEPDLKLMQQIRLVAREFGFTPSSQAGISAPGKAKEDNGKSRFFG